MQTRPVTPRRVFHFARWKWWDSASPQLKRQAAAGARNLETVCRKLATEMGFAI